VPQSLGETQFVSCATGQSSPLGDVALGSSESVLRSFHRITELFRLEKTFKIIESNPSSLSAGRKPSGDPGKFYLCWKGSFFSVHAQGSPCSEPLGTREL